MSLIQVVSYAKNRKNCGMRAIADLLAMWSALAAVAQAPGRLRKIAATGALAYDHGLHPVPTVVIALKGVVRLAVPGGPAVDLAAGDAAVVAPGAAHRHERLRHQSISLELGFDYVGCDIELRSTDATLDGVMPRQPAERLVNRMLNADRAAFAELLTLLLEVPWKEVQELPEAARLMRDRIRSHGLTPITAIDVAAASGLQTSRAWQVFRAHFGCTPRQALEQRRCAVAAALLEQGLTVAEVARRCGFRDQGTFSRAFTRVRGRPPSLY